MITSKKLDMNIYGTSIPQQLFTSDKFPKLSVTLYMAPNDPEKIIAHNYIECIQNRKLKSPEDISLEEAIKIADWVIKGGHTPALESIYLGFNISGMSKVVSHQIVRHRIGISIGQRTQRANSKEYLGNFAFNQHFIIPPSIRELLAKDQMTEQYFETIMVQIEQLYNRLTDLGISEDDARYIIPQAAETSMDVNIVYKALQGLCSTRLCHLMQSELIEIVRMMQMSVRAYNKTLGRCLKPICLLTGKCNRNENNPTKDYPKGVCEFTTEGTIPVRDVQTCFDLTKYSRDGVK